PSYAISTDDRTVGARLGGVLGRAVGAAAPPGRVRARLTGAAGQSFGAFLAAGVALELTGEANDFVGKSMSGGRMAIRPAAGDREGALNLRLNAQLVSAESLDAAAAKELRRLVERHLRYTGSQRASELLAAWERELGGFWLVQPRAEVARLESQAEGTEAAGEE